jgi:hypothetical protein
MTDTVFGYCLGIFIGAIVGLTTATMMQRHFTDRNVYCAKEICSARTPSGRYLDGKCYEAAGLREVKP